MNRRSFIATGVFSLASLRHYSQTLAQSGLVLESKTTGAIIDFSGTTYEFVDHRVTTSTNGGSTERMEVSSDFGGLAIQFTNWIPRVTAEDIRNEASGYLSDTFGTSNVVDLGTQDLDDGSWMAYRTTHDQQGTVLWYHEFQIGAFPEFDLHVVVSMPEENLEAALEEAQNVDLEGLPPFLFLEESGALNDLFLPSTNADLSRLAVPERTTTSRPTAQAEVSNNGRDDEVIESVRNHQAQFHDEAIRYDEAVNAMADIEPGAKEELDSFSVILEVMFSWTDYPVVAAELSFPNHLAELESVYLEWAAAIGEMGTALGRVTTGGGSADDFIAATSVALELDRSLTAVLSSLGWLPATHTSHTHTYLSVPGSLERFQVAQ